MATTRIWRDGLRFVAGAVAVFAAVYALSEVIDPVYPDTRAKVRLFRARAARVQAVSVGNSHTGAVDFQTLGWTGMHLWDPGQDPFESAFMVRYAAERAPRLRYVLMTASYGFERLDNAVLTSRDYSGVRRGMYLRTGARHFIPGDRNLWISAWLSPVVRTDQWQRVAARLMGRPEPPLALAEDGKRLMPEPPLLSADSLAEHGRMQGGVHAARYGESLRNDSTVPTRSMAALESLARDLRARGIVLVLYTPPYHRAYLREVPAEVVEGTRRALQPALRHPNVVWLDFGSHPAFSTRDDLFKDSDHLNPAGSRAFSALLRRCIDALPAAGGGGTMPPACPAAQGGGERTGGG